MDPSASVDEFIENAWGIHRRGPSDSQKEHRICRDQASYDQASVSERCLRWILGRVRSTQ